MYDARIDHEAGRWSGEARIPHAWLPPDPYRVNAFAMHGVGDQRRYLLWEPLTGIAAPDFHQPLDFPRFDWRS